MLFLNNRYHDPTLGVFLSVDPLVTTTGEPYIYASGNPTTLSDPTGLCPMDSAAAAACAAAMYHGYNAKSSVYMSASSVLTEESPWEAWGIWNQADYCSQCEGFDIQAGSGNACFGMSGCAAAAQYLLEASGGLVQSATEEQFATAKWLAANYCNYNDCGAGNLLALSNQAEFGAAAAGVLLAGAGVADDIVAGLRPVGGFSPGQFVDGEIFTASVASRSGGVTVMAETSVSGRVLTLSDLVIYADDGTLVNQVGAQSFLSLRNTVAQQAASTGFEYLRLTGVRVGSSSSANPGHATDLWVELSRFL